MSDALFLSVADTAALLGVSVDLVYDLTARGELPSATFGNRRMVPRRALELILEHALATFDPGRVLATIAAGPPDDGSRPTLTVVDNDPSPPARAAPIAATR